MRVTAIHAMKCFAIVQCNGASEDRRCTSIAKQSEPPYKLHVPIVKQPFR